MTSPALSGAADLAASVIDELANARWDEVTARFDETMRQGLSAEQLAGAWAQVVAQAGSYKSRGATDSARSGDLTTTNTPLVFEAGELVARISFRDDQTIAGLYILNPDAAGASSEAASPPLPEADKLARSVIDDFAHARWTGVTARFDDTMRAGLPAEHLAAAWSQLAGESGSCKSRGDTVVARLGDMTVTDTPLVFEAGELVVRIAFRDDQTISGLYFLSPDAARTMI